MSTMKSSSPSISSALQSLPALESSHSASASEDRSADSVAAEAAAEVVPDEEDEEEEEEAGNVAEEAEDMSKNMEVCEPNPADEQ